mgnify:CR=1 FL=1
MNSMFTPRWLNTDSTALRISVELLKTDVTILTRGRDAESPKDSIVMLCFLSLGVNHAFVHEAK